MNTMTTLRYGIIGAGGWARGVHIANLNQIPQAEIVAVCARSQENRDKALAACKGKPRGVADYRELLKAPDVDAVLIATPNNTHARIACEALRAGKHVFCEKPLGLTLQECDEVVRAVNDTGKILLVGQELRYAPIIREVQAMIAGGQIGELKMLRTDLMRRPLGMATWRLDPASYGGSLLDVGIHYLDLLCFLFGAAPRTVYAQGHHVTGVGYLNQCQVLADFGEGKIGAFGMCLYCSHGGEITLTAFGTQGRLEVCAQAGQITWHDYRTAKTEIRTLPPPVHHKVYGFPGTYEIHLAFIESVLTGKRPACDAIIGRQAVAVTLATQKAIDTGTPVNILE